MTLLTVGTLLVSASLAQTGPSISSVSQSNLKDVKFTWVVESANQRELSKINRDFAASMRFKNSTVEMKEPFMLRMESTVEGTTVTFIVNGVKKLTKIPRTGLRQLDDVSRAPGKRQTFFDFGLLTPSLFNNYFSGKWLRKEARGDYAGCEVYDITYVSSLNDKTRHRIWVDASKKIMRKREWYGQDGVLKATFAYMNHTQSGGVWIPGKFIVVNASSVQAGVSTFKNVSANAGIASTRFALQ